MEKENSEIGWSKINSILSSISDNIEIYIDGKNKNEIWKKLMNTAKNSEEIWVTNSVIPSEWRNFDTRNKFGIETQRKAINRGVTIKRIHVFDNSFPNHIADQKKMDSILKSELDSKYYKSNTILLKDLISKYDRKYLDIGIGNIGSDNELLIINDLSDDYIINGSWVTTDRTKI